MYNPVNDEYIYECTNYKYVVLGGGVAAAYAAREFDNLNGQGGDLCIISEESVCAYERPALSKAYLSQHNPIRYPVFSCCVGGGGIRQTMDWYKQKDITYLLETQVVKADVINKRLITKYQAEIQYEKLIIATGARAIKLEDVGIQVFGMKGIHYFRDIRDADELIANIERCRRLGKMRAVVIGGGYIGMELCCALLQNGLRTTLVSSSVQFLPNVLTEEVSNWYEEFIKDKGANVAMGTRLVSVTGSDYVQSVELENGLKLPADIVVVGIGALPNTEMFAGQLKIQDFSDKITERDSGGIIVNELMQTSDPDVYAVGDVAAFPIQLWSNIVLRQNHITHARSSASQAVRHMMHPSYNQPYDYMPYYYCRIFHLSWAFYGTAQGCTSVTWFDENHKNRFCTVYCHPTSQYVMGVFIESGTPDEIEIAKHIVRYKPVLQNMPTVQKMGLQALRLLAKNRKSEKE